MIESRLAQLRELAASAGADTCLVSKPANLHYFSGFRGDDSYLVITAENCFIVTDSRYTEQAAAEAPLFTVAKQETGLLSAVAEVLKKVGARKIVAEGKYMCHDDFIRLKELYSDGEYSSFGPDSLRLIKDSTEIAFIRKACDIADRAFADILAFIKPGRREYEIAAKLEYLMRNYGSERAAFDTIAVSGKRGSLPHGRASDKIIAVGEFLTLDFGAVYQGYHSDITRTVCVGRADSRQREVYNAVLNAQKTALTAIKTGVSGKDADAAARNYLAKHKLDKHFGHGLGHGVGLLIHEEPRLSVRSRLKELAAGMVVTDEPGVYIADWGGVRIEDTVLVTDNGGEALTHSPKDLIELNV